MSELSNHKTNLVPSLWKCILGLEIFLWLPLILIGFDPHHDGLILTNVNLLNESFKTSGEWPFNQYGPFWILPYSLLTYFVSTEITFIVIRIITLGFYFLTSYFIFLSAKIIAGRRTAYISLLVFFFSQPFLTNFGSNLVPWPSAIVMPITALIFLFILQIYKESISTLELVTKSLSIGMLISTVFFSRIQIGFFLLIAITMFVGFSRKFQSFSLIFLGFTINSSVIGLFLYWKGWLNDALSDQFVFGSTYLTGDTSSYPIPVFTIIGTIFFLILILLAPILLTKLSSRLFISLLFVLIVCTLIFLWLMQTREISFLDASTVVLRRFWISYFLAIIIYSLFSQAKKTYSQLKRNQKCDKDLIIRNCLVVISLVSMAQVFPLFDQMHFWWGSVPAVILVILVTQERLLQNNLTQSSNFSFVNYFVIFFAILTIIPALSYFQESYSRYPNTIAKYILVPQKQSANEIKLQKFFKENVRNDSKILNLCADSNIFFNELNNYKSSSRIYVFWLSMYEVDTMYYSLISSMPDYIITCSLNRIPDLQEKSEGVQSNIIKKSFLNAKLVATYVVSPEMTWRIYRE
jgi:hypothetical protein